MNSTQLKLKEQWDSILNETERTATHGDKSSHGGYFNSESGCGEPPYTGEGIGAIQELEEWEEFLKDPLAMFDWDCFFVMPELAKQAFEKWLDIKGISMRYFEFEIKDVIQDALIEKFVKDFYQVATGHDFEVVQI
jgi:hypothetical protein